MAARDRPAVQWYVFGVAAIAVAMLIRATWEAPFDQPTFRNAITAFVILGLLAEAGFFRIRVAGATSSVAFIPFLASVILVTPAWAMMIAGVTLLGAETVIRRKPVIKVVHNASKEVIAVGVAASLYGALGGQPSLTTFEPSAFGFLVAILVYFTISEGAPAIAVALSTGARIGESWARLVGGSLLYDFVSGPIAVLLAWFYVQLDLIGVLVVIVPLFFIRHVYQMNLRLEQVNADLLELMVKSIEARDPYTSGHSLRVSKIARAMAQELGLATKQVDEVATAALLHDVGKIYEEFATLLRKEGRLLPHEQQMMQSHPVRSAELVSTISTMRGAVEQAVRHHHESYNGTGYPDGLAGVDIPIGSRIIAIADTVDAMTTDRPYRDALPFDTVLRELRSLSGRQFDPDFVTIFCSSERVRAVIDIHLQKVKVGEPKTVADTFNDLRRALTQVPASMAERSRTEWSARRASGRQQP